MLSFVDVTCIRGGRTLFAERSFALGPGDAVLVQGANGTGKSSLIRIAAGLLRPARGRVTADAARALLTEQAALDDDRPLAAVLRYWAKFDGGGATSVTAALTRLALAPLADVPVRLLSTGQRRRAAFARVLASGAPLWLLDEPANGLDAAALARLEAAIAAHRAAGGAVLVASHTAIAVPGAAAMLLGAGA